MRATCEASILTYAPDYRQRNAALLGEHAGYVKTVLKLLRDHFHELETAGETTWSVPAQIDQTLTDMRPEGWE
jgi:hypothetical protein